MAGDPPNRQRLEPPIPDKHRPVTPDKDDWIWWPEVPDANDPSDGKKSAETLKRRSRIPSPGKFPTQRFPNKR